MYTILDSTAYFPSIAILTQIEFLTTAWAYSTYGLVIDVAAVRVTRAY